VGAIAARIEVAQFEALAWTGMLAPASVAHEVIDFWNGQANLLLGEQRFVDRLAAMNVEAAPPGPPGRLRELMQAELTRWLGRSEIAADPAPCIPPQ
jgi:hypothetical protein